MTKQVLSSLIALSLILSPALRAEAPISRGAEAPVSSGAESPASTEIKVQEPTPEVPSANPSEPQTGSSLDDSTPLAVDPLTEDLPEEHGTPVGKASNEGKNTAKKRQWQNIAIAVCAVAVAVTALILVSSNDGHKK